MRARLFALAAASAAILIPAMPAAAEGSAADPANPFAEFAARPTPGDFGVKVHRGGHGGDRDRWRRHRDRRGADTVVLGPWYGGEWALYNNRSWAPDSFNDWWHDRPDRAFPRWVQDQRGSGFCPPERVWWSGSGWRC
ncbi:MAG TPA: hypothetical protein VFO51_03260 [Sphingomicrobium sp.]|nr:hypothetical protein [Sphingomicrobium sp.]